jgi:hypothetical protein
MTDAPELQKADEPKDAGVVLIAVVGGVAMTVCEFQASGVIDLEHGCDALPERADPRGRVDPGVELAELLALAQLVGPASKRALVVARPKQCLEVSMQHDFCMVVQEDERRPRARDRVTVQQATRDLELLRHK